MDDDELDAFGDWERAVWEVRAAPYAAAIGALTRGSVPALLDAAGVGAGTRLLDVGTGPGFVAVAAAERGAAVAGVDQSTAMVELARAAGVEAVAAPVEQLPFADGAYDAVVASYVLNHLARPEQAVAELGRVLAAGGRLAVTVWDLPDVNAAFGLFGPVVTELGLTAGIPPGPDAQRLSDPAELHRLLAGWRDVRVEPVRWAFDVEPGAWFDAVAKATPRTGSVLEQASPDQRAEARQRFVALATSSYGARGGRVALPAAAVLASATRP